ncbi:hypothetical protein DPMN_142567 [Dreissena polymorpha]|uniref:Neurotransmitter-gated ion-channel transmembrane domain-containing protein n=1 Tax=Dreissena polymorpha TaxID=45954 RepID=A0A9D4JJA2_DREPO|nr:hypothetical protein DPMN_142567 [Dreissena polymorpha]
MCKLSFSANGYEFNEVFVIPESDQANMTLFTEHPMWDVFDTQASSEQYRPSWQVIFGFKLKRKPEYVIVNVLLPILFLSVLNMLVFLLVPESGERIAYCITVLLSIAVFMTIDSAMLPRTSKPATIISFTLMIDIALSSAITVMAILNLRIYIKDPDSPVPKWMIAIYRILTCALCRKRKMGPL